MLDKHMLRWAILDALAMGVHTPYSVRGTNPYDINVGSLKLRIFISNVQHAFRADDDEMRIQCRGGAVTALRKAKNLGRQPIVLGYASSERVFCAWDPRQIVQRNVSGTFSLYTRQNRVTQAASTGVGVYEDNNGHRVVAFREDALLGYCSAADLCHDISPGNATSALYRMLFGATGGASTIPTSTSKLLARVRKRVSSVVSSFPRDPRFPKSVLRAYEWHCAICDLQLGLVDAAHIIPHGHPKGVSEVTNGVALCKLHHSAYDTSLIRIETDYSIHVNDEKVEYLKLANRADGLAEFTQLVGKEIRLPSRKAEYPDPKLIRVANKLRRADG